MGSLALLARESGHEVTNSDINCYPPISDQLDEMGIDIIPNYDIDQLNIEPDLVVIGNVMSRDMEIIEHILDKGLPILLGLNGWEKTYSLIESDFCRWNPW